MENQPDEWPLFSAEEAGLGGFRAREGWGTLASDPFLFQPQGILCWHSSLAASSIVWFPGGEHQQGGLGDGRDGGGGQRAGRKDLGRRKFACGRKAGGRAEEVQAGRGASACSVGVCCDPRFSLLLDSSRLVSRAEPEVSKSYEDGFQSSGPRAEGSSDACAEGPAHSEPVLPRWSSCFGAKIQFFRGRG